jgi:hypothetical protein
MSILLVDLPGYGFAFASEEKEREWQSLMKSYLWGRGKSLKRILLLVDARHGLKKSDVDFLESMQEARLEKREDTGDDDCQPSLSRVSILRDGGGMHSLFLASILTSLVHHRNIGNFLPSSSS